MDPSFHIIVQPAGRRLRVAAGTRLSDALAADGFDVHHPCGGTGTCGKCRIRVLEGAGAPTPEEEAALTPARLEAGIRLACQGVVARDMVVELESSPAEAAAHRILSNSALVALSDRPAVTVRRIPRRELPASHAGDEAGFLAAACGGRIVAHRVLTQVPRVLHDRQADTVTAFLHRDEVIALQAGHWPGPLCGIALDIGTTTLAATLVDLERGEDLAGAGAMNPQSVFGDDVISRVRLCRETPDGLDRLRARLYATLGELFADLLRRGGMAPSSVFHLAVAGNTAMQQIFAGINPHGLGELPFAPVMRQCQVECTAGDLGLPVLAPDCVVTLFPQVSGFVGGDLIAGLVATGFEHLPSPSLFIDVGTNGEMALAHDGKLLVTSVAAGPAFEGARIRHGMRATSGAIEDVTINGDLAIAVIGNAPPRGLCGSALIDAVAELLRHGVVDSTGRFVAPDELPAALPDPVRRRVISEPDEPAFLLADNGNGNRVCLFQRDLRELQLANGAIRAGASILLQEAGVRPGDLQRVLVAGGFGNYIRRQNACRIGMLPPDTEERILFAGNTSLLGAKMALLSQSVAAQAEALAGRARHVDLSANPAFQLEFSEAMVFPEPA